MITISACMIVKDEEKVLARCLDSIRELVDEIIIVDTGSSDRTKEIAGNYTEHVFDFPWDDDFASARNFSFEKATKDYIYAADADEVIDEENKKRFQLMKEALLPEIEIVQMFYSNQLSHNTTYNFDREYRPKLYKRLRTFLWTEPLHEAVRLEPVIWDSDIEICHMPLETHASRDFTILKRAIKKHGDLSGKLKTLYARELFIAGKEEDFREAADYFIRVTEEGELPDEEFKICQSVVIRAARLAGNEPLFFKHALRHLASGSPNSEVCWDIGEYYRGKNDLKEAILWYYNAAFETEAALDIRYGGVIPLQSLEKCCGLAGREAEAKQYKAMADQGRS